MSTQSHPIAPRRTYLIGRARPNAIVGKNRETGEIALIIAGAFLGMMCGLLVPMLPLRIMTLTGFPMLGLAAVYVPYKGRTFYKWFEIRRSFRRTARSGAVYRSGASEAGVRLDGREVEIGPPPGIGRINWLSAPFGPDEIAVLLHADRKTVTAAIEIEGPGVGLRDSEDQEALVDRFGTLLKHVANGDGFVTRLQMLARTLPADPDAHAKDVAQRGDTSSPAGFRSPTTSCSRWSPPPPSSTAPTSSPVCTTPANWPPRHRRWRARPGCTRAGCCAGGSTGTRGSRW